MSNINLSEQEINIFKQILKEDDSSTGVCASDFASSVPEHILGTKTDNKDKNKGVYESI